MGEGSVQHVREVFSGSQPIPDVTRMPNLFGKWNKARFQNGMEAPDTSHSGTAARGDPAP